MGGDECERTRTTDGVHVTARASRPRTLTLLFSIFAALVAAFAFSGPALAAVDPGTPSPAISSDQADYAPGSLVTLAGSNWAPGETVHIYVNDDQARTWDRDTDVTADANGAIEDQFTLPDWFVATYAVRATGPVSGTALSSFTDAINVTFKGTDDSDHSTAALEENLGSVAQAAVGVGLTCPRGTGMTVRGTGLGGNQTSAWTVAFVAGAGDNATLSSRTTLTPASGTFGSSGGNDSSCVAMAVNTSTLAAGTTYHGQLRLTADAGNATKDYYYRFTIAGAPAKLDQTITFGTLGNKTFGDPDFAVSATASSGLAVSLSALGDCNFALDGKVHIAGAGSCTITASQAGNSSYNAAISVPQSFTIAKATASLALSNLSHIYDGSAKSATVTTTPSGLTGVGITYDGSATAPTSAGSYAVVASLSNPNYAASNASDVLVIAKASQTINFPAIADKTFGDAPFAVSATGGASANPVTFIAGGGSCASGGTNGATVAITGAGTCTVTADQAGNANYDAATSVLQTFQIEKAASVTSVTCPASTTYTGSAQTPCTATVTGAGGLNETLTVTHTDNTNAGTAHASASYAGDDNHTGSNDSQTFKIEKAGSVTSVTCPASTTYTGSAQTPCTATVTGAGGLNETLTVTHTDNTNAGTAHASASFAGDDNHTGSNDSQTFQIDKANASVAIDWTNSVYDGAANPASATVTGPVSSDNPITSPAVSFAYYSGSTATGSDSATAPTNAGTYTVLVELRRQRQLQPRLGDEDDLHRQGGLDHFGLLSGDGVDLRRIATDTVFRVGDGCWWPERDTDSELHRQHECWYGACSGELRRRRQPHRQQRLVDVHDREGRVGDFGHLPDQHHLHRLGADTVHRDRDRCRRPEPVTDGHPHRQHERRYGARSGELRRRRQPHRQQRRVDVHDREGRVGDSVTCPTSFTYTVGADAVHATVTGAGGLASH